MPTADNPLTRKDWAALRAAGCVIEGSRPSRRDPVAIAAKMSEHLLANAVVETEDAFAELGIPLKAFVHTVLQLPEDATDEAREKVEDWCTAALKGTSTGPVQINIDGHGWLVKGKFDRTFIDEVTNLRETQQRPLWAVTRNVDLVMKYATVPAHTRTLSYVGGNLRDQMAQAVRIPEMAAEIFALQRQRLDSVVAGTQRAYVELTDGMDDEAKAEFDARVTELSGSFAEIGVAQRTMIESGAA